MQRTEQILDRVCHQCHFSNDLGCEIYDTPTCMKCGASLEHDTVISYNDNCPLCGVSFEIGKPYVFHSDGNGNSRWICSACEGSPRGIFYQILTEEKPEVVPPCCLCGNSPTLVVLTRANPDGEYLCDACSTSDIGKRMLEEHDEGD